jgi:hypothetical protein
MAEQLIVLAPGEERVIRIRCGEAAIGANAMPNQAIPEAAPQMNQVDEIEENIQPPVAANPAQENIAPPNIGSMAQRKGTRKNRKQNGATRKNRKQSGGNSYMNFAKVERKKVLNDHPELKSNVVAVARKIGEAWRKLSESERKKY